jgi:hypothetical protein
MVQQPKGPQVSNPAPQQKPSVALHASGVQQTPAQRISPPGQQTPSATHTWPSPQQVVPQAGPTGQQVVPFRQPPGQHDNPQRVVPDGQQTEPAGSSMH